MKIRGRACPTIAEMIAIKLDAIRKVCPYVAKKNAIKFEIACHNMLERLSCLKAKMESIKIVEL